jgi:basic amino acid/polyamine antiporter, APA family
MGDVSRNTGLTKSMSKWDLLALGIGCVVGWSWVIYAGMWGSAPGTLGGVVAFAIGGALCTLLALVYSELTAAFPRAGGDVVFVFEGLGEKAAIVTAWCVVALWAGLVVFETMTFPIILEGLGVPVPRWGNLYTLAGEPVFLSFIIIALAVNAIFAFLNYRGVQLSSIFQIIAVLLMLLAAVLFFGSGITLGKIENAKPFFNDAKGLLIVMLMVPSFLAGFNAIPQVAEDTDISPRTLGKLVLYTVWGSVLFYAIITVGLSFAAPLNVRGGEGLVVVKAVDILFNNSPYTRFFVTFAALLGMLTTWNAAYLAGSRLLFALSRAKFLPSGLTKIHHRYNTPYLAILIILAVSSIFPLLGTSKGVYMGIVNIFSFFLVVVWLLVSIAFIRLRYKRPDLKRPYTVPVGKFVGWAAIVFSACYLLIYTPISPVGLNRGELIVTGIIIVTALVIYFTWNRKKGYLPPDERRQLLSR